MSAPRYLKAGGVGLASGGAAVVIGLAVNQVNLQQFDQRSMVWLCVAVLVAAVAAAVTAYTSGSDTQRPVTLARTDHADRETFDLTTPGERRRMLLLLPFNQQLWLFIGAIIFGSLLIAVGVLSIAQDTAPVRDLLAWIDDRTGGDPYTVLESFPLYLTAGVLLLPLGYILCWFDGSAPGGHDRVIIDPHGLTVLDLRRVRPDRSYSVLWADLEKVRVAPTSEGPDHAVFLTFREDREPDYEWHQRLGLEHPSSDGIIAFHVSPDLHDAHGSPVLPRLREALARFGPAAGTETDS